MSINIARSKVLLSHQKSFDKIFTLLLSSKCTKRPEPCAKSSNPCSKKKKTKDPCSVDNDDDEKSKPKVDDTSTSNKCNKGCGNSKPQT
ncbi:hypothetical protein HCN44_005386 [Aphidius gifuensis]|uniref:Uncharacterized protein n=1 Tax=Aphidius gifuensis TaxID=684658 RepID=A0A835CUK3_APHGI|nr:hypothetical protein HCN44_005386 [Aphidius gifuensis]